MRGSRRTRRILLSIVAVVGVLFGSIAFSEWLADGTGSGRARAGVAVALQATEAEPTELLYPGTTANVGLTITNPNPFPVVVSVISGNGTITSNAAGCDSTNHAVTFTTQVGSWPVAANSFSAVELQDAAAMGITSADECQGAAFSIPVALQSAAGEGTSDETFSYYTGPEGTEGVGECKAGTVDGDGNIISPEVTPTEEIAGDGLDNDCDGAVDETDDPVDGSVGDTTTYQDLDGDGYGNDAVTSLTVYQSGVQVPEPGYVLVGGDCDDSDPNVNPGAVEIVGDEIDNDCDGLIDE